MKPHELLGTASIPGEDGELRLYRHDRDYFFRLDSVELMSSRVFGSEQLLAELGLEPLADVTAARVLVCGLGMGFTLARVLELVGPKAVIDLVELVPEVVEWNREWLGDLAGHPLRDSRVRVTVADVVKSIRKPESPYDAILLDVDNGPEGLTRVANDWLYKPAGLHAARMALRRGGVLAIWSSTSHPWFSARVRGVGLDVREERVRARRDRGPRRTIWIAQRP